MMLHLLSKGLYPFSIILMISLISGCTTTSNESELPEQTGAADKVTLKMVQSLTTPQRTRQLEKLIAQFEKEHPNIGIELISPDYETADDTILSMLDKREAVDIVEVRDITAHVYASRGLLVSLEKYIGAWDNYTLLSDNARLMARDVADITYYIPSSLYQVQLYYRKDWFDARALQVPETWEQLFFVGKQLTKPEIGQYGFAFRGGRASANTFSSIIQDYNGSNVSASESMFNVDGTTIFESSGAAEGLELYRKLYLETSHPTSIDWGFNEQIKAFTEGKAAMLIQDSDVIPFIEDKLEDSEWATAPLPVGPEGVSHYNVGAAGWGIALQSKHRDAAWLFISYLSSLENNRSFADAAGVITIYNNALEQEKYATGPYAPYMLMSNDPIRYQGVKQPSHYANYSEYLQLALTEGRKYLQESISTDTLLKQFDVFWKEQRKLKGD
ncbi:extracellular solute-binding protein [Paenibacillus sp. 2TAB23]|uniref:ABC transporter substrate-binding protein n=1 Tax=Paenibacillus sp. 2TAB23 TaxID=3233004 RepID=UPI003F9B1D94